MSPVIPLPVAFSFYGRRFLGGLAQEWGSQPRGRSDVFLVLSSAVAHSSRTSEMEFLKVMFWASQRFLLSSCGFLESTSTHKASQVSFIATCAAFLYQKPIE